MPPSNTFRTLSGTAIATALSLPSLLTAAGDSPAAKDGAESAETVHLDRVTVHEEAQKELSSPKFTAPLRDTPQTLVVVPKLVIEQQGAQTLSDVLRNTPGITFAAGEGGNVAAGDSFFMRGFDTSNSIFVDGVRDTGSYTRDVFNYEQVEIAKGPAGADNGRGGASGYVNLVTKTPVLSPFTTITALAGSDHQQRATLDTNQSLDSAGAKGVAIRLNGLFQDAGVSKRDTIFNSSWGLAPSLALGLGTPTRVVVAASHLQQNNLPDSGLPVVALPEGVRYPAGVAAPSKPVAQENFYGLANEDFDHIQAQSALVRLEHDFDKGLALTHQAKIATNERDSLTTYLQNSSTLASTFPAATTPVNPATGQPPASYVSYNPSTAQVTPRRTHVEQTNTILSDLTNLSAHFSTGSVSHALNTGLELNWEWQKNPTWQPTGGPATGLYEPDAQRSATVAQTPYRAANLPFAESHTDTQALYVFDTLALSPAWSLNLSSRLERYRTVYDSLAAATPSAPQPVATTLETSDTLLSLKAGLVYKPSKSGSLYLAYGTSSTPSGSAFTLSATANNQNSPNLDPQETTNLEAGVKWDFLEDRLSTSLAFFKTENKNMVSNDAVSGLVTQDISQEVQGVELGLSGRFTNRWLVFGGIGYLDSNYRAAGTTSAANDGAGLRFTPRVSGSLWTTYILPFGLTVGGGVQYSDAVARSTTTAGDVVGTTPNVYQIPEYWLLGVMADYALSKNISLRLNVQNVADADSYRINNNGGRYYPGTGRSWTLSANVKL